MSLDIFQQDTTEALSTASRNLAPSLPATYSDTFATSWNYGLNYAQSIAGANAHSAVVDDLADEYFKKTGDNVKGRIPQFAVPLTFINEQIAARRAADPNFNMSPMADDELERRTLAKTGAAREQMDAMQAREKTFGGQVGSLVGSVAASARDPVNLIAFPLAAPESLGIIGTAVAWAGIGSASQAAIEALAQPYRQKIPGFDPDAEAARNIVETGLGAGAIGGALKGLVNSWTRIKTGEWPRTIRDAGAVVESEANIQSTNRTPGVQGEVAHRTAMQQAIEDLVAGRPVDVDNVMTSSLLNVYEARLAPVMDARAKAIGAQESAFAIEREGARLPGTVERLSEQQLGEIRNAAVRSEQEMAALRGGLAEEAQGIGAARNSLVQRDTELEGMRSDIGRLQSEAADARARAEAARTPTDATTQARIEAIDADLQKPNLSAQQRGQLQSERASITETLAKTSEGDARQIASLKQEAVGLERALTRSQKALAAAEKKRARDERGIVSRETQNITKGETLTDRATTRAGFIAAELRRAISRLANDGYGLKIPREDAEAFAAKILSSNDNDLDAALRDVTETLVDRKIAATREAPPVELPFGTSSPVEQKLAERTYHTEEARKRVTALAREVGYEMPRDEAAAIASRIVGAANDNEALQIVDELFLRPRTLADTLPGSQAVKLGEQFDIKSDVLPQNRTALAEQLTPNAVEEMRADPELPETVSRNFDRLRADKGDIDVPMGVEIGPDGKPVAVTRKLESVMADIEQREIAAREIAECVGPQPEAE